MRRILFFSAAVALVGCMNTIDTSPQLPVTETNVAGRFALSSANGQSLPIVAQTTVQTRVSLVGDTMVIDAGGTWAETATYQIDTLTSTGSSTQTGVTTGTWAISNQQINFTSTSGGGATFAGAVARGTLTIVFNSGQFIYTKV